MPSKRVHCDRRLVTDTLAYQSGRLSRVLHTVTVNARDVQGLEASKTWSFKVVKKRR
jgi:hypothetical protein